MYNVSEIFKQYIQAPGREFNHKAEVNGVTYDKSQINKIDIYESISESGKFCIGSVISSKLSITIKTQNAIPDNARIIPYVQLVGEQETEWVPLGEFYIDSRSYSGSAYSFIAYDNLVKANTIFNSELIYPVSMQEVFDEILLILGVQADDVTINPSYMVPYKDEEITIHDMLSYIASAHAGCFKIGKDGRLKLVKPQGSQVATTINASTYTKSTKTNALKRYTKIRCIYNIDGEYLEIGEGSEDNTLEFDNLFITEDILENIYSELNGFYYIPVDLSWRGNPAVEPGDKVILEELSNATWQDVSSSWDSYDFRWDGISPIEVILLENRYSYSGGLHAISKAESDSKQQSEFMFDGDMNRKLQKMVQKEVPYYGVVIGRSKGLNIKRSDGLSEVTMNSDILEYKINGQNQLYLDVAAKKLIFDGTIYARNLLIGGDNGVISFNDLTDTGDIIKQSDLSEALQGYVTTGTLSDELSDYITSNALTTELGKDYIITGKILANQIAAGTLSGVTIDVDTNATVGDKIQLGSSNSHITLENIDGQFYLTRNGYASLKFWSNALWVNGNISIPNGRSIGIFDDFDDSNMMSSTIYFFRDQVRFGNDTVYRLNMGGNDIINVETISAESYQDLNISASNRAISLTASELNIRNLSRIYSGTSDINIETYSNSYDINLTCGDLNLSGITRVYSSDILRIYANYGLDFQGSNNREVSIQTNGRIILSAGGYTYGIILDSSYIGFFGSSPSSKTTISDLSSSATPEQTRSKLIDLINALQSYGLV